MKHHINNKGILSPCLAFIKGCPYTQHFDDKNEGMKYIDTWENNRVKHPKLAEEKILEPNANGFVKITDFSNKTYFKGLYVTEDSFVYLDDESDRIEQISEFISNNITNGNTHPRYIAEFVDTYSGPNKEELENISRSLTKRFRRFGDSQEYKNSVNEFAQTTGSDLKNIYKMGLNSGLTEKQILKHLGYKETIILVDKNTFLKSYTRDRGQMG